MNEIQELAADIKQWFAEHHTTRKFVKWFVVGGVGFLVANSNEIANIIPADMKPFMLPLFLAGVAALDNYVKNNTELPLVGKKAAPAGRKR